MEKVIVKQGQSIIDVAVEHLQNADAAYAIALLNGFSVTQALNAGTWLKLPTLKRSIASEPSVKQIDAFVVTVKQGQSIFDIAVQYCGEAHAAFELAKINNITVTTSLVAGTTLLLPKSLNEGLTKYFKDGKHVPATAANLKTQVIEPIFSGIDYWAIENDFIVQ